MMDVKELKEKLAEMDAAIDVARLARDNANLDLELLVKKRQGFARINCSHPETYERSVMGRDIDTYCKVCGSAL